MIKLANRFDRFMRSSPVLSLIRVVESQRGSLSQAVGKPQNQIERAVREYCTLAKVALTGRKPTASGGCI